MTCPWKRLQTDSFIKKASKSWKDNFRCISGFKIREHLGVSVWAGQQISRLRQTPILCSMDLSLPQTNGKAWGDSTQSSCFSPSLAVTSTTRAAVATSGALLRPQSLLPADFWSGLAAQSSPCLSHLVTYSLIFSRYLNLEATALLNSKGPAYSFNHKREHSRRPQLSLVKPGQRQLSLSKTGETENWPICCKESWKGDNSCSSIQDLKSSQRFVTAVWCSRQKKSPIQALLGKSHPHTWAIASQSRDAPASPTGRHMPAGILHTPWHNTASSWSSRWDSFP